MRDTNSGKDVTSINYYSLEDYHYLELSGPDALKFIQSQVTCDMRRLEQQEWLLGAQCNPKGRMVLSFVAFQKHASIFLRVHRSLVQAFDGLKKYAVFTKVNISQCEMPACALVGEDILERASTSLTLAEPLIAGKYQALGDAVLVARGRDWLEVYGSSDALSQWLAQGGADASIKKAENFDAELIKRGIAEVRGPTVEEFIPQMFNLDQVDGISFKKGCYTGQEIVARMQYLGKLKKHLYRGSIAGAHLPVGAQLYSAAHTEASGQVVLSCGEEFLAVVNDQAIEQGGLSCPGFEHSKIQWLSLPYAITM
ncbi:MAG: hypothetical protein U1F46_06515 [Marinagarivorans sp.]